MEVEIAEEGTLLFEIDEKFCLDDLVEIQTALKGYVIKQKKRGVSYRKPLDLWKTFREINKKAMRIQNQRSLEEANKLQKQYDKDLGADAVLLDKDFDDMTNEEVDEAIARMHTIGILQKDGYTEDKIEEFLDNFWNEKMEE